MDWVASGTGEPLDTLEILGIAAHGYHGVLTAERAVGQPFIVDVRLFLDTRPAATHDDLDLSVDYAGIAERVTAIIAGDPVYLIETLAGRIADAVLDYDAVCAAQIAVHKPNAPMSAHVNDVVLRIHRSDRAQLAALGSRGSPGPPLSSDPTAAPAPSRPAPDGVPLFPRRPPVPRPGPGEAYSGPVPVLPDAVEFGPPGVEIPAAFPSDRSPSAGPRHGVDPEFTGRARTAEPSGEAAPSAFPHVRRAGGAADGRAAAATVRASGGMASVGVAMGHEAFAPADARALLIERGLPLTRRNLAQMEAEAASLHAELPPLAWSAQESLPPEIADTDAGDPSRSPATSLDAPPLWPTDAILGIGANLGDALVTLRHAIDSLRSVPGIEVIGVSPLARTKPVGFQDQPDFFNAVVAVRTTLSPRALLYTAQGIEEQFGRDRTHPGGPRTLDIDLIAFDTLLDGDDELEVPHPRAHERAFVLLPWAMLSPDAFLPGLGGGAVTVLAERAPDRDGVHWLALDWLTLPVSLTGALPKPPHAASDVPWAM
ncbi:MAG: 2-amino-4-hydroxy-6-hydroxymethyldihydropteridine diphosphokinase [Bifidobacteriaceae bacterium]|jgi:dihydroneopterin aldolase/2-amino-4-hydroxy-6-hydroxymethyldihydropteridine diphosphokinase|nr:2-amino-4-hydroxy-6-hydroxymethyldihydropteridine diphosphokinase [Bifidobacteriaceae bacterium]